jgi:hypothetical protein
LLDWHAFERAIDVGYRYTRAALDGLPALPRLAAAPIPIGAGAMSLIAEIDRRKRTIAAIP